MCKGKVQESTHSDNFVEHFAMMSRVLLLSVASASSFAVRARVPASQPLRAASVRMMASASADPAAFVKSSVASDKVAATAALG